MMLDMKTGLWVPRQHLCSLFPGVHGVAGASGAAAPLFSLDQYSGTGVDDHNVVIGGAFSPDLLYINRFNTGGGGGAHQLVDSVRGPTINFQLLDAGSEDTLVNNVQLFNADGFQVGTASQVNQSGTDNYISLAWKIGAGLSVVGYTGNGANRTIAHTLPIAPAYYFVKRRVATGNFAGYHAGLNGGTTPEKYVSDFNTDTAEALGATYWNDTAPTASVFSLGTHTEVNESAIEYMAYLFAAVPGKAAFGEYAGTGASNAITGLGFLPSVVYTHSRGASKEVWLYDSARGAGEALNMTSSDADETDAESLKSFDAGGFTVGTSDKSNDMTDDFYWAAWA